MVLTRRYRAAVITIAVLGAAAGIGFLIAPDLWRGFVSVVRQVSGSALAVSANFAPASIAYFAGASPVAAQAVGAVHTVAVLLVVVVASRRCTSDASLLVTAVASQVVSPVMWDHYAVVLFLPIAWLLARRQWWALLIGIGLNAMLILVIPPVFYIASMDVVMLALLWVGRARPEGIPVAEQLSRPSSLEHAAG